MTKRILISFVNWMKFEETLECVRSIIDLSVSGVNISIVENGSVNDSYQRILEAKLPVNLIRSEANLGYAGGHQLNVDYALKNEYDYVLILNSDILLFEKTIEELISLSVQYPNSIVAPCQVQKEDQDLKFLYNGKCYFDNEGKERDLTKDFVGKSLKDISLQRDFLKVSDVGGAAFLVPTEIVKQHGFIKTDFFLYCEELDYFFTLRKKGYEILLSTKSHYVHSSQSSTSLSKGLQYVVKYYRSRNYIRFCIEHKVFTKEKIWKDKGGKKALLLSIVKNWFFKQFNNKFNLSYYESLGFYHGLIGKKGKVIDPNKFL